MILPLLDGSLACSFNRQLLHKTSLGSQSRRGFRDSVKVKAAMEMNTFTAETTYMINTSSGHCADNDVKDNLINVKE